MAFTNEFIEQLKIKNDIVDVISAYTSLERRGGSYWACCPLPGHMEKTASFAVNPVGQFFKCFGCGRGGNVINFIMEIENLSFAEAVKFLADRAGLEMPQEKFFDKEKSDEKRRQKEAVLAILKDTAHFYVDNLKKPQAQKYLDYLASRGLDSKIIRKFGIGVSLDFTSLPKHLAEKGHTHKDMLAAGVVSYNQDTGEYTDFEAKRITVPIIDNVGNVIAFGGRVIEKTDFMKYKNTKETSVFIKNRCLYNINHLKGIKREVGELDYVIMVEGYMDVISLAQAGFMNVVASMGTSLTVEQAKLLLRYTKTVIISYDGDGAGQKATMRGLEILRDAGLTVKIISLPDGLDPDDMIKKRGKEAYQTLLDNALPLIDYKLEYLRKRFNLNDTTERRKFVENALRVIRESDKDFEKEELLRNVSKLTNLTYESLKRDLEKGTSTSASKKIEAETERESDKGLIKAERFVLWSGVFSKPYFSAKDLEKLTFSSSLRTAIADYILETLESGKKVVPSTIVDALGNEFIDELNAIFQIEEVVNKKFYFDCVRFMEMQILQSEIDELKAFASDVSDLNKQVEILKTIQQKTKRLNALKKEEN